MEDNQKLILSVVLIVIGFALWIYYGLLAFNFILNILGIVIALAGITILMQVRKRQTGKG